MRKQKHTETFKGNVKELVKTLNNEGLGMTPTYVGFGLEIYHCADKMVQVQYDCRNDKNEITIRRGF